MERAYGEILKLLKSSPQGDNELFSDKLRVSFNLLFESLLRACRHLSVVLEIKSSGKECVSTLGKSIGFEKDLKRIEEFYFSYRDLKNPIDWGLLKGFLEESLPDIKDFAKFIANFVRVRENNPFLIDFEFLTDKAKKVIDYVSKIEFVLAKGKEEFCKSPMYYDRARYFYFVVFDSLFDICKHIASRLGVKKLSQDCFSSLIEINVLPAELKDIALRMHKLKDKLSSSWEVKNEELYEELSELLPHFKTLLSAHSQGLKKALIIQR